MTKEFFKVLRPGINTTYQDKGRENLFHIGIPFSGAMDYRNFIIANSLTGNKKNEPVIEFAYQGPHLLFNGNKANIAITGDVNFNIIRNKKILNGKCYQSYTLNNGDQIDILSTNKSVYGYLSINGGFNVESVWNSCSINTQAKIGPNNGQKLQKDYNIEILRSNSNFPIKKIKYTNFKIEYIRVIKGTNFNYFSENSRKNFFKYQFTVSKLTDRMGMRLEGKKIDNAYSTNIKSEGLIKGVIQVPADGNPIIMLSDHGTIGGYPKIAVVISADYDKLVQIPPGSKIKFKEVNLSEAENLFKLYDMETQNIISQIE